MSKKLSELYSRIKEKHATIQQLEASLAKEWRELDGLLNDLAIEAELEGMKGPVQQAKFNALETDAELDEMRNDLGESDEAIAQSSKKRSEADQAIAQSSKKIFQKLKREIETGSLETQIAAVKQMAKKCHSHKAWAELKKIAQSSTSGQLQVAAKIGRAHV